MFRLADTNPRWQKAFARGAAAPSMVAGVVARGGGLADIAEAYRSAPAPRVARRSSALLSYEAHCATAGSPPWPADTELLCEQARGWLVAFCAAGNAPSSAHTYLGSWIPHVRDVLKYVLAGRERSLYAWVGDLASDFPHEPMRAKGITEAMLRTLVRSLGASARSGNLHGLMWTAMLTAMWAGMLRLGEVADAGLRFNRVLLGTTGPMAFDLPWRKAEKRSRSRINDVFEIPLGAPDLDAAAAMRDYAYAARETPGRGDHIVFPPRRRSGKVVKIGSLARSFNKELRRLCKRAYLDAGEFERWASHGIRRGGRTALQQAAVDDDTAGVVGGWKSTTGQRPYKEGNSAAARLVGKTLAASR